MSYSEKHLIQPSINVHVPDTMTHPEVFENVRVWFHESSGPKNRKSCGINMGDTTLIFWDHEDVPEFLDTVLRLYRIEREKEEAKEQAIEHARLNAGQE